MEESYKGVTAEWKKYQKRGKIKLNDGRQFPFTLQDVTNVDQPQQIRNNLPVEVVLKGETVQSITVLGIALEIPAPSTDPHPGRFLNPYNFVRNLPDTRPTNDVMGRVPPPPHDRYVGLTGRITCTLTNVTPLFISDAHAIIEEDVLDDDGKSKHDVHGTPKKHYTYRFFTAWDENGEKKYAIPASSLRGMLRGVYETITNSCYMVFDGDRKLEYREEPGFGNLVKGNAAIIRQLATEDKDGQVELCRTAKIGAYYTGEKINNNAKHTRGDDIRNWRSGEYVMARAHQTSKGRYIIREFAKTKEELQPLDASESYLEGWLKITGCGEGTQKLSETLFLNSKKSDKVKIKTFTYEQQEEYNAILGGQQERGRTPVGLTSKELTEGDLVWLKLDRDTIERLVRVQIPRTPFTHPLSDFLPHHLHACENYAELCPACRVFGWVYQRKRGEIIPDNKINAYAGRIQLSHALITKESGRYKNVPLAILASPKPTENHFYLLNKNGLPDKNAKYTSIQSSTLRGRKYYRHHGIPNSGEYVRAPFAQEGDIPEKDDQSRTIDGALAPESTFEFILDFENLAKTELAALLYVLELESGMVHRLGYAKPLGFGSVKIEVTHLGLTDVTTRWETLDKSEEGKEFPREAWEIVKASFLEAMKNHYGHAYDTLLTELKTLLSAPSMDAHPIHYPRPEKQPNPEGRQFEWFVGNKNRGEFSETLPVVENDTNGMPIMNKEGNIT